MATVTATELDGRGEVRSPAKRMLVYQWSGLTTTNDVGSAVGWNAGRDRTVQAFGTFGTGGHVKLEGSNDGGTTWAVLNDPQGSAIDFTAAGIKAVQEAALLVRPKVTAGDGTTSLTVIVTMGS